MSSNSNHEYFLHPQNVDALWISLHTHPNVRHSNLKDETILRNIFTNNLKVFYNKEKVSLPSVEQLNSKFLLLTSNYILKKFGGEILEVPPVTFNEIQEERKNLFERELNKKKEEFQFAIREPVPPVPNFQDKEEQPLDLELAMKRVLEERKYDIPVIPVPAPVPVIQAEPIPINEYGNKKSVSWNEPLTHEYDRTMGGGITLEMIFEKLNKMESKLLEIDKQLLQQEQMYMSKK
jgi:hypothetical protein